MKQSQFLEYVSDHELPLAIQIELQQREEEGYDLDELELGSLQLNSLPRKRLEQLYRRVLQLPPKDDYPYHEPDDFASIQSARPEGPRQKPLVITPAELLERIYGGWLARVAGCVLGKPIEAGWSKKKVIAYLKLANAYPLLGYIPRIVPLPEEFDLNTEPDGTFLGEIKGAPPDDDTDFTFIALHILESYGLDFTTAHVATEWVTHLAYFRIYTAERVAYRNLICNIPPEESADYVNPLREFIGGRIRADLYGFISPRETRTCCQTGIQRCLPFPHPQWGLRRHVLGCHDCLVIRQQRHGGDHPGGFIRNTRKLPVGGRCEGHPGNVARGG